MRKKKCKNIDDKRLIMAALKKCFSSPKTKRRLDTLKLFQEVINIPTQKALVELINNGEDKYKEALHLLAEKFLYEIKTDTINFPKHRYEIRRDGSNGKERRISILNIKQLAYDHIAVMALEPVLKGIGQFQVSSIRGKGGGYAIKTIRRWMRDKRLNYFIKLDIKKYFPSIDQRRLVKFLIDRVDNQRLIRLVARLIISCDEGGIHIGSYLSQSLANYYLSYIYHKIDDLRYTRRDKSIKSVEHLLFYMDDFLLLGRNKRKLQEAAAYAVRLAKEEMGLTIKPNYCVQRILDHKSKRKDKGHWIDMVGYRFSKQGVTLRKSIFRRAYRMFIRVKRSISTKKHVSFSQCSRLISYWGFLQHTNCFNFFTKNKGWYFMRMAKTWVRMVSRVKAGKAPHGSKKDMKEGKFFRSIIKFKSIFKKKGAETQMELN